MGTILRDSRALLNARIETAPQCEKQQSLLPGDWGQVVLAMLGQAAEVLGAEMTSRQYDAYLRLLEGVPVSELAMALDRCLRESTFMPKPSEILAGCGRSPEAMADRALLEALVWVQEWGARGRKPAQDEPEKGWEDVVMADGTRAVRILARREIQAPPLPMRTQTVLRRIAGDARLALERLLGAAPEPEKYARFRREFLAAWREV